jgi:hypothetical protein
MDIFNTSPIVWRPLPMDLSCGGADPPPGPSAIAAKTDCNKPISIGNKKRMGESGWNYSSMFLMGYEGRSSRRNLKRQGDCAPLPDYPENS